MHRFSGFIMASAPAVSEHQERTRGDDDPGGRLGDRYGLDGINTDRLQFIVAVLKIVHPTDDHAEIVDIVHRQRSEELGITHERQKQFRLRVERLHDGCFSFELTDDDPIPVDRRRREVIREVGFFACERVVEERRIRSASIDSIIIPSEHFADGRELEKPHALRIEIFQKVSIIAFGFQGIARLGVRFDGRLRGWLTNFESEIAFPYRCAGIHVPFAGGIVFLGHIIQLDISGSERKRVEIVSRRDGISQRFRIHAE